MAVPFGGVDLRNSSGADTATFGGEGGVAKLCLGGLRRPIVEGPVVVEPRRQETAVSLFEGAAGAVWATGVLNPPIVVPPEMTTVEEGVGGGALKSGSLESLNDVAPGFKPEGKERLPNLPPRAAVIGKGPCSLMSSLPERREERS